MRRARCDHIAFLATPRRVPDSTIFTGIRALTNLNIIIEQYSDVCPNPIDDSNTGVSESASEALRIELRKPTRSRGTSSNEAVEYYPT